MYLLLTWSGIEKKEKLQEILLMYYLFMKKYSNVLLSMAQATDAITFIEI